MKIRRPILDAMIVAAGLAGWSLRAQEVTVGEPGWFQTEGAPDQLPRNRHKPDIEYPEALRTADEPSYVILARYIAADGTGLLMEVHSAHPWFKGAVEDAVGDWPMHPATLHGHPVPAWFWIPVIFNPAATETGRPEAEPRLLAVTPVIVSEAMRIQLRNRTEAWGTISLDAAGTPQKVVLEPSAPSKVLPFVEAALTQWRFAPARRRGAAVAADIRVPFYFFAPQAPVPRSAALPKVVRQSPPVYPLALQKAGITGEVVVEFVIDQRGDVANAVAARSTSPDFNAAAVEAVRRWKFKPATVDGRAVNTRMRVPIIFNFNGRGGNDEIAVTKLGRRAGEKLPEEIRYDVAPQLQGAVEPVYPYALLQAGTTGKAAVLFEIDPKGRVVATRVVEASRPEFGLALAASVALYKFDPALKDARPTTSVLRTERDFSPSRMLTDEDRAMLRSEKKHPEAIVGAGGLDAPLRPLLDPAPVFPLALRDRVEQGSATVEFLVDERGRVRLPRVKAASDPAFGYAAVQAVSLWLFSPPKAGGKTVVARVVVPFEFRTEPPVMGTAVGEPTTGGGGK